jgi:hypothetical protein
VSYYALTALVTGQPGPVPTRLTAAIVNVYAVPAVSPVTIPLVALAGSATHSLNKNLTVGASFSRLRVLPKLTNEIRARCGRKRCASGLGTNLPRNGWDRYAAASRKEKGEILTAFCLAAGYHRKYALTLLQGSRRRKPRLVRATRRRRYGPEFQQALKVVWEAAGHICSERLQPFIGDLVPLLKRHGQLEVGPQTEELLLGASVAVPASENVHTFTRPL